MMHAAQPKTKQKTTRFCGLESVTTVTFLLIELSEDGGRFWPADVDATGQNCAILERLLGQKSRQYIIHIGFILKSFWFRLFS
jgi:hypothetical protein